MQKDYLRRTATTSRRASTDDSHHHHLRHSYLPSRSSTGGSGSIKDSAGGEVSGDRVILYIHGPLSLSGEVGRLVLMNQAELISSRHSTRTDTKSSDTPERLAPVHLRLHTV